MKEIAKHIAIKVAVEAGKMENLYLDSAIVEIFAYGN